MGQPAEVLAAGPWPIGALFLSLVKISWSMPSFAQLTSDMGTTYSLTTYSPKLIKQVLHEGKRVSCILCRQCRKRCSW